MLTDLREELFGLSADAIEELRTRLEDSPEKMSTAQLADLVKLGADRTGHGPQSSRTNVNVDVDVAAAMQAGRKRVEELEAKRNGE